MAATSRALLERARRVLRQRRARAHGTPLLLQLKAAKLPTPELEVVFAPDRKWAFDYAWRPWMIALEVEGGVFVKSRHTSGLGYTNDCEKYNAAAILGWLLIRATTAMVDDGRAIDALRAAFSARGLE
jgi:hypothetical protein